MNPFETTPEEQRDHMLRHTVKAKDVPVGMTFYTNYDDYNLDNESGAKVMNEALYYTYTGYGFDSDAPIDPEQDVYVSKPELCGVPVVPDSFTMRCPETGCDLIMHTYRGDLLMLMILDPITLDSMEVHLDAAQEQKLREFLNARA